MEKKVEGGGSGNGERDEGREKRKRIMKHRGERKRRETVGIDLLRQKRMQRKSSKKRDRQQEKKEGKNKKKVRKKEKWVNRKRKKKKRGENIAR